MLPINYNHPRAARSLRHTAALLCIALASLSFAAPRTSAATPTGPLTTSPNTPTPFQAPVFHSGGGPGATYPTDAASAPYLTPLIDPLQNQLQGTPTERYPFTALGVPTQIPSYLLGNYDPTQPPAGLTAGPGSFNVYYPNHFADGLNPPISWAAPFAYTATASGTVTVDDSAAAPQTTPVVTSGFTSTGFTQITSAQTGPSYPSAGTAVNSEYLRLAPNTTGSAVWTLYETTGGIFSVYFHVPNDLPDSNGAAEPRSTQVNFQIVVRDNVNGNVLATTTATASQTEANDAQFLAGPFRMPTGGVVTVTLARNNASNAATLQNDYLVADSMTLQPTIGDVQSAPTVITHDLFPQDFESTAHPLQYWGIFVPPAASLAASAGQQTGGSVIADANPDTTTAFYGPGTYTGGNILLKSGRPAAAKDQAGAPDPLRRIRQLVYFGRSDPAASIGRSVDDSQATVFTGTGTIITTGITATASTASNSEYQTSPVSAALAPNPTLLPVPVATWSFPVLTAGTYFVSAHLPATPSTGTYTEKRSTRVYYSVAVNGGTPIVAAINQVTQGTDALVNLPTGALTVPAGGTVVVSMYAADGSTTAPTNGAVVVADSITVSTGTGQGAIYCVDGFNGGVVWRFETPGSINGASSPVFSSPAIAKINVLVTPPVYSAAGAITTPAVYANRLVVVVGDNHGLVYCLDAIGNGDGTSNADVLARTPFGTYIAGQPVVTPQPTYGGVYGALATPLVAGTPDTGPTGAAATAHVGTTGVYWIYRPDPNQPKYVTGTNIGKVKAVDPTTDLPVPAAFNTASPNIFVDPTVSTTPDAQGALTSNAKVYIGNSNGVLYALDALGTGIDGTSAATYAASGDKFNVSQTGGNFDVPTGSATNPFPLTAVVPTPQPLWWFSLRGVDPNSGSNASSADIESAPAISVKATGTGAGTTYVPTVYIGSAHELETTSNVGRLYALNGLYGPSSNNGRFSPIPTATNYAAPGSFNYNVGQVPQTGPADTADWSFPDGNTTTATGNNPLSGFVHQSSSGKARPALGNITGSPVVFTNTHEPANPTRIYFAAASGQEFPATARPDDTQTGRIWAVNLDGSVGTTTKSGTGGNTWAYPLANNPNNAALDATNEPVAPIGAFLRATPAIGYVQFPATITRGDGNPYAHADAFVADIKGQAVPMLYVGTRGTNDTALYAVDIDGNETATTDQRTIYRLGSPSGSIYQSSPVLIANATTAGGNGGSVFIVGGSTLYDYSATPISNPFAGQPYPLVRLNQAYGGSTAGGYGPISSPAVAGANTTDFNSSQTFINPGNTANTSHYTTNSIDWVYVGDSSTGLCRGITPNDSTYGGFGAELYQIVPYDTTAVPAQLLTASIQTFLVPNQNSAKSADALGFGPTAPLPVYEWGESAYVRFSNVAPPNPIDPATSFPNPNLFVHDSRLYPDLTAASPTNPIPFYTSDGTTTQTVTFDLSDVDATSGSILKTDNGSVQPKLITTPPDGFVVDQSTPSDPPFVDVTTNLIANNGKHYLGTYTYTIGDGTARNNTPGARRRFQNVRQVVTEYDYDGTTYTKKGTVIIGGDATAENLASIYDPIAKKYTFTSNSKIKAVDQPTFGILNPLAVRGGGVPILPAGSVTAVAVGDEAGPFRSIETLSNPLPTQAAPTTGDVIGLQALTNGNDVLDYAPPSSSGVTGDPTVLLNPATNPLAPAPTTTKVIVTATGLISHNTVGDNSEPAPTVAPTGTYSTTTDGLLSTNFGGYSLNAFDRSALFNLSQTLRLKMTVPSNVQFAPQSGRDGLYWNSNVGTEVSGHDSVVNFLPWETAPIPYSIGINTSLDYPDIAPGNVAQNALANNNNASPGDLTSNSVTLPQGTLGAGPNLDAQIKARKVYGDPVQIKITVPHYQSANQQLYQQNAGDPYISLGHEIAPIDAATGTNRITLRQVFPMGYVTSKRLFVPSGSGFYSQQRPYRDVRVYTGVPIDMRTSIANPTTDIGKVPAAFGVQTESDPSLLYFTPYSPAVGSPNPFLSYFKPLEVHNDGNTNLLNVHFDQRYINTNNGSNQTLPLNSDAVDPLSMIPGYDQAPAGSTNGVTGPRALPEEPFLIRTSVDTDIFKAYGRNPYIANSATFSPIYPGATFHKPIVGGDQPSTLTVPDAPESYVAGASLDSSPTPIVPTATAVYKSAPFASLAIPFGTPAGTYTTQAAQSPLSLRLFEGLDTVTTTTPAYNTSSPISALYPPQYNRGIGGITTPSTASNLPEVYTAGEPLSTTGTQLSGTVLEQRLTDGASYGAVPMIDAAPAGTTAAGAANSLSYPDFAPAAFRDLATGNLSVYWTSGRNAGKYGIYGANLPFVKDPSTADLNFGHFMPVTPASQWWQRFTPSLQAGTKSGLSITPTTTGTNYAFGVNVASTNPYSNTLYGYPVIPGTGALGTGVVITPSSDGSQVKYGVKGLYTGFTNNALYAFWTGSTRGRTALYYSPQSAWGMSPTLLPVPAGLTAVADASPLLIMAPVVTANGLTYTNTIEVTYSGTGPDGNADLYASRYLPHGTTGAAAAQLDQVPFPAVTEDMRLVAGWYQARDVAWSRTGALNLSVTDNNGKVTPLLYSNANPSVPLFTKAIYDKASGFLVLTNVQVPIPHPVPNGPTFTTNTVYVDAATGRVRFSPALNLAAQNFARIQATFSPLARRLTVDTRADVAPVSFLDDTLKPNDTPGLANVNASRRWTIWRKSGVAGLTSTSTLYFKTQRLTLLLPTAVDPTNTANPLTIKLNGTTLTSYDLDYLRGRVYFPLPLPSSAALPGLEGQTLTATYADTNGRIHNGTGNNLPVVTGTVQWQDEPLANDTKDALFTDSAGSLNEVIDNLVPIDTATNENNVAAFLDPYAGTPAANGTSLNSHKVWLFWNSTRNGTADIYSETIDPRFAPTAP